MKFALPMIAALALAAPALAQDRGQSVSFDLGLGASVEPTYPGSDEHQTSPWLIFRSLSVNGRDPGARQGFSLSPDFNYVGERDADDDDRLEGLDDVDRTIEIGLKATYAAGPTEGYAAVRKGIGGHEGVTGEFGARYRIDASDRLTLWAGLEAGYGDDNYNETYFGVTSEESMDTDYGAYAPGGGINSAAASLEGRYDVTPNTAILGELKYSRIIGDAADSPIVLDESQPSVKLGIVRTLNFGF